jgi:hypothetical protein
MAIFRRLVMAGLFPAIHVLRIEREDMDARHKAGRDGLEVVASPASGER